MMSNGEKKRNIFGSVNEKHSNSGKDTSSIEEYRSSKKMNAFYVCQSTLRRHMHKHWAI